MKSGYKKTAEHKATDLLICKSVAFSLQCLPSDIIGVEPSTYCFVGECRKYRSYNFLGAHKKRRNNYDYC